MQEEKDMDVNKAFSLEGRVALVTGAAYGIGFAIAEALANAGAKIAFNCRGQHHLDTALEEYAKKGIDARGYICDVTKEDEVTKMVADIKAMWAGGEMEEEDMDEIMQALQEAYWEAKKNNRKYVNKRYRKDDSSGE